MKRYTFWFADRHSDRLDAIAAELTRELGVDVDRTTALRVLIDRFFLPTSATDSEKNYQEQKAAELNAA
jgi:phosphopantetheinyl transferase